MKKNRRNYFASAKITQTETCAGVYQIGAMKCIEGTKLAKQQVCEVAESLVEEGMNAVRQER